MNRLGTRHRSLRGPLSGLACTIASVLVLTACSATGPGDSRVEDRATARQAASETSATPTTTTASGVTVVAVGDVACAAGEPTTATKCRQADTARLKSASNRWVKVKKYDSARAGFYFEAKNHDHDHGHDHGHDFTRR